MTEFDNLRISLDTHYTWPAVYMFKFIVPSNNISILLLKQLFNESASLTEKNSSKQNYVSITITELMLSTDEVISKYTEASKIEGVIAL